MKFRKAKLFEIHTSEEWIRDFGRGSEQFIEPKLDPKNVPRSVRHLVGIASRFGIADDVTRHDRLDKLPASEARRLYYLLRRHRAALDRFIDQTVARNHRSRTPEERCFLYLGKCYGEVSGRVRHLDTLDKLADRLGEFRAPAKVARWNALRRKLHVNSAVSGSVVLRTTCVLYIEIRGFPGALHAWQMVPPRKFGQLPKEGSKVSAFVRRFDDSSRIVSLHQAKFHQPSEAKPSQ